MIDRGKDNLLLLREVRARVRLSRTTIYRRIANGTFPKQHQLSPGLVAWYESDIEAWVSAPMEWCTAA